MNKFQLRKKISKIRSKFAKKKITVNSEVIIKLIEQKSPNKRVGLYYPFGDELSTLELMNRLIRKKFIISLPIVNNKFEMSFYSWSPNEPLTVNRFGILEPFKGKKITFHDPCYLGRANGVYEAPRNLIKKIDAELIELKRSRSKGLCCGAGGAQMFKDSEQGRKEISSERAEEIEESEAEIVAAACPFCNTMISDGLKSDKKEKDNTKIYDIAELIANANDL